MFQMKREFSFIKNRKIYYIISVALIVIGLGVGFARGFNFGIDFTGGTSIQFNLGQNVSLEDMKDVIKESGLKADVQYGGDEHDQIIVKTVQALDKDGRNAFYENVFEKFGVDKSSVVSSNLIGPSVGELLKANAIKAMLIAMVCMLIYIIIRFEWKFGVAAIISVLHDVLLLIAFYGLFNVTINSPFIAGLLTVLGYSINDTIVVFDRIRDNLHYMKKNQLEDTIDRSINQTLVRSIMTSLTTIIAIVPLFILCGSTIREFVLPLIVGVAAGSCSSIFIASPIYFELCRMTSKKSKYQGK